MCSLVQFHPNIDLLQLFSSSLDCGIRIWDLRTSLCVCVLQSHYSAVTSLSFSPNGNRMIRYCDVLNQTPLCVCVVLRVKVRRSCSSGRDKICTVWDLKTRKAKRTVPVYEVSL